VTAFSHGSPGAVSSRRAVAVADVEAGEVDQGFEGAAGGLRAQGVGAQVDVGVPVAPLTGQVG
jgi:hypothetical protein